LGQRHEFRSQLEGLHELLLGSFTTSQSLELHAELYVDPSGSLYVGP